MAQRILIVEDDEFHRMTLERYLSGSGVEILAVESAERALANVARFRADLVITDINLGGLTGFDLLHRLREAAPEIDVIMVTAFEDMQNAIDAIKAGAYDYLVKPLDLDQLELVVERCFQDRKTREQVVPTAAEAERQPGFPILVGRDPQMIELYKLIARVAQNHLPVLIRGETGTGKEVIARTIHRNSLAAAEPFVAVNCAALPETLLESELFGHLRGAFTGAAADRKGRFELAGKGAIFLDEIGDTGAAFQAKLLRVLQEHEFYPVGGEQPRRSEARVITATHRPVAEMVRDGTFREDLYFRLRVVEIVVPPLRERRSDIPLLVNHILAKVSRKLHKEVGFLPNEVMPVLLGYDWPGNIRELENTLTRAAILAQGSVISLEHLELGDSVPAIGPVLESAGRTLEEVEKAHVSRILAECGGNKTRTAAELGVSRPRLDRIIDKFQLAI
jgi:two-component system response regulator HydG